MRNAIMKISTSVFLAAVLLLTLGTTGVHGAPVSGIDVRYTSDSDFDKGSLMNLNHETVHDQLQLSDAITPFPFINIAKSDKKGTIVRIDVNTGTILGEYYTAPNGMGRNPSRTTVDQFGNVWVSNRNEAGLSGGKNKGSITRVGLIIGGTRANADGSVNPTGQHLKSPFQYNTCIDRNGDGLIKTSREAGNVLSWSNTNNADTHGGVSTADDECIINYTRVIATNTRTVAIDANNDVWVGGENKAHEKVSGVTGQPVPGTQFNLGCGGYGGLIDKNGVLWSSRYGSALLRYDTKTMKGACLTGRGDYGLGLDPNTGEIWHTQIDNGTNTGYVYKLAPDGSLLGKYYHGARYAQGVVVDKSGNVWVAHSLYDSSVGHLRTDGTFVGNIKTGSGPTGVAVDANGKVWSTNYNAWNASRIDPNAGSAGGGGFKIGAVDKTVNLGTDAYPYNYSDMTGYVAIGGTSPQGTWTVIQDSGTAGNEWGTITWNSETQGNVPDGAIILVEARAADTEAGLSSKSFIAVSSNEPFVLSGRYLEVRATLKPNSSGEKPVLSDLRISITPISDVRVIDTISSANIFIKDGSFTREPYSITYGSDTIAIEWRFDSFTIGQINDLSYSVTMKDPVPGENRLIDHKIEVLYTDINGNPVRYETAPQSVHVLSSRYASSVATDKQSYRAKENALIAAAITNLSQFARTIDAKITIEDGSGVLVQEVSTLAGLQFTSGETKNVNTAVFNTGTNSPGNYRARLALYEGQNQVGTASADFTITPDIALNSSIVTDKISYKTNEQVSLTYGVQSLSDNYIFEGLTARVSVKSSQGVVLHTESKPIAVLTPGQRVSLAGYWNTGTNAAGAYLAVFNVLSGETVLSQSSASFEIKATAETGGGITGTIAVSPSPVYQGRDETLVSAVTNGGNEDLNGLTVNILVVDPDNGEVKLSVVNEGVNIGQGATVSGSRTISTRSLAPKIYLAILQVQSSAMTEAKTLASAAFEVKPGIEISKRIPDQKRVLVWLNYPWQSGQNCPDRATIEQALTAAGLIYHIVLDKDAFEKEFRNPFYTDFFILGDYNPIEDHFAEELREMVNSGKGLIYSLFNRQNLDAAVFNLKFTGALPAECALLGSDCELQSRTVELSESEIFHADTFQASGTALRIAALDPADVVAWIPEVTSKGTVRHPGILRRQYGNGHVVFFAFDLGMSSGNTGFLSLLTNAAEYIHNSPQGTAVFAPNQVVPVEITLTSMGAAFDLTVTETYPLGLTVYDPAAGIQVTENPWVQNIHIGSDEAVKILYYVHIPDQVGVLTFGTEVVYLENGVSIPCQTASLDIDVQKTGTDLLGDALTAVKTMAVSDIDRNKQDIAIRCLESVQGRSVLSIQDADDNIRDIRQAIASLLSITNTDVSAVRLLTDALLQFWEAEWYALPPPT